MSRLPSIGLSGEHNDEAVASGREREDEKRGEVILDGPKKDFEKALRKKMTQTSRKVRK